MPEIFTVTVSQINRRLASIIKDDKALSQLYVRGEISNYTLHKASGHIYFTLRDETAGIKCVMFRSNAEKLRFALQNGMRVLLNAGVSFYERDGACQLYVNDAFPEGAGEMYLAFEQAKNELEKGGYFSQKRDLPSLPKKICLITAEKGAALQDMLNIISRRCPIINIVLIPVTVQGITAPVSLVSAVNRAQETDADLIIIGRGGGSAEDLAAFNDIGLAKALYSSRIPTISAVGHETDFTIADFVADKRAPTPSAAAEIATAVTCGDMLNEIGRKFIYIKERLISSLDKYAEQINASEKHISALTPIKRLDGYEREINLLYMSAKQAVNKCIDKYNAELDAKSEYISALNPLTVLSRGYSIVKHKNSVVYNTENISEGDTVKIMFSDGSAEAVISKIQNAK